MNQTDRIKRINQTLQDLYNSNVMLSGSQVYRYLIYAGVTEHEENHNVNENLFENWISRFENKANIRVFNADNWKYFCQFKNGYVPHDCIKIYIPLDYEHLYEGANQIFDFLAENGIAHCSKIGSDVRTDDVVIRVKNPDEARLLQSFVDNNSYLKEGMMPTNPFCINQNGVGYAFDGSISYNYCVADTLAAYINEMRSKGASVTDINLKTYYNFLEELRNRPDIIRTFKYANESLESLTDTYLAIELQKRSLTTNKLEDYLKFYQKAQSLDKIEFLNTIENPKKNNVDEDKKELWDEAILTTMKKYYKGKEPGNPERSGFDYLHHFLRGHINGMTRDHNLRDRVTENLSLEDIRDIVETSRMPGRDLNEMTDNYIKMTMMNEVIRCSRKRFPREGQYQVQEFMETGYHNYITNSVGQARNLSYTLDAPSMRKFMEDLGVRNVNEYMARYYSESKAEGRVK